MKQLLFFLLLSPLLTVGQWKEIQVPATQYGQYGRQTMAAIYSPPEAKDSLHKTYPVILWFCGRGEGTSNISDMYKNGLPQVIKGGMLPQAVDPKTGRLVKFYVVAVQWEGSPYPAIMRPAWEYIQATQGLQIDTTCISLWGLSAGGKASVLFGIFDTTYTKKFSSIITASPEGLEEENKPKLSRLAHYGVPVWAWAGKNDGPFIQSAEYIYKEVNFYGGNAVITRAEVVGHGGWNTLFNGTTKIRIGGKDLNAFEYALYYRRAQAKPVDPPVPPTDTAKVLKILHDPARVQKIIILDKDGTWSIFSTITSGKLKLEFQ